MSGIREQLINIYSSGPVEQVHNSEEYQKLCRDNEGDRTFNAERFLIEDVCRQIDFLMQNSESYREQVHRALRHLRKLETAEKKKLARTLVLNLFAAKWSTDARKYFEDKSLFMIKAKDYFLSFTNRNPNRPHQNHMNRNHRYFIRDSIGQKSYDGANLSDCNLVAEAVCYHLKNSSLDGFFYPRHEENNQNVEEKLSKNCENSFAFVQLIQAAMFKHIPESPNWCFFEYDLAHKQDPKCILFVQIEDNIQEDKVSANFDKWYRDFSGKDTVKLKQTRSYSSAVIEENSRAIEHKLSEQIENVIAQVYRAIPD